MHTFSYTRHTHMHPHLIDSLSSKSICHPFAGHSCSHEGDDILQTARQLEHDDYQRHSHPSHAACGTQMGMKQYK